MFGENRLKKIVLIIKTKVRDRVESKCETGLLLKERCQNIKRVRDPADYIDTKFHAVNLPCTHTFSSVPRHFSMLRARLDRRLSDENVASIVRVRDSTDNHLVMHLPRKGIHICTNACNGVPIEDRQ